MTTRTTDVRICDDCGVKVEIITERHDNVITQDYDESWKCPHCGFPNNRFAVPLGD